MKIGTPYLHSPGNSAKLGTSMAPRTAGAAAATAAAAAAAGGSGAAETDRSTGRVVVAVPFSGCAAPSLHPGRRCGVVERSAAIEEGERRQRRRRRRWGVWKRRRVQRLPYSCQSASGLWGGGALRGGFWRRLRCEKCPNKPGLWTRVT